MEDCAYTEYTEAAMQLIKAHDGFFVDSEELDKSLIGACASAIRQSHKHEDSCQDKIVTLAMQRDELEEEFERFFGRTFASEVISTEHDTKMQDEQSMDLPREYQLAVTELMNCIRAKEQQTQRNNLLWKIAKVVFLVVAVLAGLGFAWSVLSHLGSQLMQWIF